MNGDGGGVVRAETASEPFTREFCAKISTRKLMRPVSGGRVLNTFRIGQRKHVGDKLQTRNPLRYKKKNKTKR